LAAQQSRNQASAEAQKAAKEKEKAEAEAKAAREKENKEKEARDAKAQEAARQQAAQEEARIKAKAQGQAASERDAQRAAAILSGRMPGVAAAAPKANAPVPAAGNGDDKPHIILIGAYANQANVANLRKKLAELKIKSYTEPLGNKTRVRAGPFANRAEAEAALAKMQKIIDVGGVVAAKP
jgi:DedD protein